MAPRIPFRFEQHEPQTGIAQKWTISRVERALDSLERGEFVEAALLAEAMGRDDRIEACWTTRYQALLGLPFEMLPNEDGDARRNKAVAKDLGRTWFRSYPEDVETEALYWRVFLGFAVGQVYYETDEGWVPRVEIWHPQHLVWNATRKGFDAVTTTGVVPVEHGKGWIVFGGAAKRPWMRAAVRSLSVPWLSRHFAYRDWNTYNERHGKPIVKVKFPANAGGVDVGSEAPGAWYAKVQQLGSKSVAYLPQGVGEKGEGFDLDLLESKARSEEAFAKLISHCDTSIAIRLLGQNLTTEVQGGSRAAATVHDRVRLDYLAADAEGEATDLHTGVAEPWALRKHGSADLGPWPTRNADPPEDQKARAEAGEGLGKALKSFGDAGYDVENAEDLAEEYGFEIKKREAPEPPAGAAATPANNQDDEDAEPARAARARPRVLAQGQRSERPGEGYLEGQGYVDALVEHSSRQADEALQPDLIALAREVAAADGYDDMRSRLRALYAEMSPEDLTVLVESAHKMAELAGRTSVNQDASA